MKIIQNPEQVKDTKIGERVVLGKEDSGIEGFLTEINMEPGKWCILTLAQKNHLAWRSNPDVTTYRLKYLGDDKWAGINGETYNIHHPGSPIFNEYHLPLGVAA
jgi:hypothetical protein